MAISTYAQLKTAIGDWPERADLASRVGDFIMLAEAAMNRSLRVARMITRATAQVDTAFAALPSNFLEVVSLTIAAGPESQVLAPAAPITAAEKSQGGEVGKPLIYSILGDELQFCPTPDQSYLTTLSYYARIPALSDSAPSNWLLNAYPDAYLYGALLQAAPYLRDNDALQIFQSGYTTAIQAISNADRTRAGRLRAEPGLAAARGYTTSFDI